MDIKTVDIAMVKNLLTAEVYAQFKLAVELGKWADGRPLTDLQRQSCLQGIILYEDQNVVEEQRTAYLPPKPACPPPKPADLAPKSEDARHLQVSEQPVMLR